ncbi:MAG: hypothetical protein LAO79_03070 [Acidobacteriia bacterium]|nr:hypothetical protein [Terriglobia bacterium]
MIRLLFLLTVGAAWAQSGMTGYVAGFLSDARSGSVRPIYGMPGAQTLGPRLSGIARIDKFAASETNDFAVAIAGNRHVVVLQNLRRGTIDTRDTGLVISDPDSLVLSGSFAAARDDAGIVVIGGLPQAAAQAAKFDLPVASPKFLSLAIDADHQRLLAAVGDGVTGGIYSRTWTSPDAWHLMRSVGSPQSLILLPGGDQAVYLDSSAPALWLVSGLNSGNAAAAMLASETDGVTASAKLLYFDSIRRVAMAAGPRLALFDPLRGEGPSSIDLPAAMTRFERAGADFVILDQPAASATLMLDIHSTPFVYFVPAACDARVDRSRHTCPGTASNQ